MGKRILVTSTDLMMVQFLVPHIQNLSEHGYEVEIACSDVGGRMQEVREKLRSYTKAIHSVRLHRSPVRIDNINGYRDMKKIISTNQYDIIWTNEPVMGVVTRLAAKGSRKRGTKVLYMTHGFHFFKDAPLKNWIVYFPVEYLMSLYTDVITTINNEDYTRAKKMKAKEVRYVHGIGVDTSRLMKMQETGFLREELGLQLDDFILLSVGELNKNKNQKVIIEALARVNDPKIHYVLCGKGDNLSLLKKLAKKCNLEKNIHFLGYRKDVVDICSEANAFAFPSRREGLGLAPLEAMYAGLPLLTSKIRGPVDFMKQGETGYYFKPDDSIGFAKGIQILKNNEKLCKKMGMNNQKQVEPYCLNQVKEEILKLINEV